MQILTSKGHGTDFKIHGTLNLACKAGLQMFAMDPIGPKVKHLRILILESYGADHV